MALKKGAPGKGGDAPRREQFSYTNTQAGLKHAWTGWLACEPYWCEAHEHKPPQRVGTKPCLAWLTDRRIHCPWCRPAEVRKWIGYVFVYREMDRAPVLVLVHDSVADLMGGLGFGAHVLIGRVEGQASCFVKLAESCVPWRTDLDHRKSAIDSALSLLGIWNIPALNEWYAGRRVTLPDVDQVEPGKWRLSVPPATTDAEALAIDAEKKAPAVNTAGTDDALQRALRRKKQAEGNGKHRPEE